MAENTPFDEKAETYDDWYTTPFGAYADEAERALVFRHVGPVQGRTVLDVGCGTGVYSIRLSEAGADVTAVDVSHKMLEIAQRKSRDRGQYVWYEQADMQKLPYESNTFDLVVSITALEFVSDPLTGLMEMARVLRPGGKLTIGVLNSDSPWADACRGQASWDETIYGKAHLFSSATLRSLFHRTGTFGALTMESCLYTLPTDTALQNPAISRQEILGRLFRPLTGAFLVGTARKR